MNEILAYLELRQSVAEKQAKRAELKGNEKNAECKRILAEKFKKFAATIRMEMSK